MAITVFIAITGHVVLTGSCNYLIFIIHSRIWVFWGGIGFGGFLCLQQAHQLAMILYLQVLTQNFISQVSGSLVVLPSLGYYSFLFTLITEQSNIERHLKRSPALQTYFSLTPLCSNSSISSLIDKISHPSQRSSYLLYLVKRCEESIVPGKQS